MSSEKYSNIARTKESLAEAGATLAVRAIGTALKVYDIRQRRRELHLLQQGITDDPEDWKRFQTLGTPLERSKAYETLFQTLERTFNDKAVWQVGKHGQQVDRNLYPLNDWEITQERLFAPLPLPTDGEYDSLFLYNPASETTGALTKVQRRMRTGRESTYTVTHLLPREADGKRHGTSYSLEPADWNTGSPLITAQEFTWENDRLDDAMLTGELFAKPTLLLYTASESATGYHCISAPAALELADSMNTMLPVRW